MDLSAADRISATGRSFLKNEGGVLKLLIFFVLAFSCLSLVAAAPIDPVVSLPTIEQGGLSHSHNAILQGEPGEVLVEKPDHDLQKRQAGLAWGPVYIGNLKLSLTNPHDGYAGPKFRNANHVNFHVDKEAPRNSYDEVVNLHMVKYTSAEKSCFYAWDSVTRTTVFDNCFDDFSTAIAEAVSAAKSFVDSLLQAADFIASVVIIAALVVALAAALTSLGVVALA